MITILGMLVIMFFLNWDFTLVAVAVTPLLLLLASRFKKAVKKSTHEVRKQQSNIVAVVQQDLESIRVVTAFGRQELEQEALAAVSQATVAAALKARQVKALLSPIVSIIVAFCIGFVLWRGSLLILAGWMTAGELTVFLSYLGSFFKPVKDLASMNNSIAQTAVAVERIRTILDADAILPEKPDAREQPIRGEIVFDHVAFAYDESCPVLRDVSFTVKPGQMIGVVGPTGGGKSTIMSLIPRFYDPSAGKVLVDDIDCKPCATRSAMCCRRRCSSADPCAITSRTAVPAPPTRRLSKPRSWPTRTSSSPACPMAIKPSSATGATHSPAASGSVSASRARSYAITQS
jgi:ABC-type multidrug transport system fused ATPase/permease subunit